MKNLKQLCDANNRRDFIQKATTIALGAAILPNMSAAKIEGRDESRALKYRHFFTTMTVVFLCMAQRRYH